MSNTSPAIGFIGLGLMGQAFTARLVELGYTVIGYDINPEAMIKAAAHGVIPAASVADLSARVTVAQLCLISTTAVAEVIEGEQGLLSYPGDVQVVIDHSTTIAAETRRLAARTISQHNIGWVDAPVSGGPPAARAGSLAMMAGGRDIDIERVESLLLQLAETFTHMGPVGAGQVTKMVNQVLVLNNYTVLAEALTLAEAGGVDASKVPAALGAGHAGSNLLQAMFPRMLARDFDPAGYARQVLKDLDMVGDLARELGVPTPMSAQTASLYRVLVTKGHADLDGIAILKLFDPGESI
jgi:3-hydroxyisobutyrate dehydrogenase